MFKLALAVTRKESSFGSNIYGHTDGAVGASQFTRGTRENWFARLPEREQKIYGNGKLYSLLQKARGHLSERGAWGTKAIKDPTTKRVIDVKTYQTGKYLNQDFLNYTNYLTDTMLSSPTLPIRLMVSYLEYISTKVEKLGLKRGTSEHAKWVWFGYNVGPGFLSRELVAFDQKFPNPRANKAEATAYLKSIGASELVIERAIKKVGKSSKGYDLGRTQIKTTFETLGKIV